MKLRHLPNRVLDLFQRQNPPSRLIRHHELVHDACCMLLEAVQARFPGLPIDHDLVLLGAAIHDAGKLVHRDEISGPGHQHEEDGPAFLVERGFEPVEARFAMTHGRWGEEPNTPLEDLLVALSDEIWKGGRNDRLESRVSQAIADETGLMVWEVYLWLDQVLVEIAEDADGRLAYQAGE